MRRRLRESREANGVKPWRERNWVSSLSNPLPLLQRPDQHLTNVSSQAKTLPAKRTTATAGSAKPPVTPSSPRTPTSAARASTVGRATGAGLSRRTTVGSGPTATRGAPATSSSTPRRAAGTGTISPVDSKRTSINGSTIASKRASLPANGLTKSSASEELRNLKLKVRE
ncbi:unnamed protein product [Umbelopsis ramanniana]